MSWILELARPEIVALKPYQHASWEPAFERLHANELPWRAETAIARMAGLNRYPEPQPHELVAAPGRALRRRAEQRAAPAAAATKRSTCWCARFCRAGQDNVLICPPTFGMYAVVGAHPGRGRASRCRCVQGARLRARCRRSARRLRRRREAACSCARRTIRRATSWTARRSSRCCAQLARPRAGRGRRGLHRVRRRPSLDRARCERFPNLVVLRTLSKAHGLAGARCGTLIAHAGNRRAAAQGDSALCDSAAHDRSGAATARSRRSSQSMQRAHRRRSARERERLRAGACASCRRATRVAERRELPAGRLRRCRIACSRAARGANLLIRDVRAQSGCAAPAHHRRHARAERPPAAEHLR